MISKLICALFGHAPLTNVLGRTGYADVCGAAFDGIKRGHLYLTADCPRCGATYSICNVHAYAEPPLAKPEVRPASSVPDGWVRAVDEALVVTHLGVANESDTYEQAREKLNKLFSWYAVVATDPAVNGGYKLMPVEPTKEIYECFAAYDGTSYSNPFDFDVFSVDYRLAIEAAPNGRSESPETKP